MIVSEGWRKGEECSPVIVTRHWRCLIFLYNFQKKKKKKGSREGQTRIHWLQRVQVPQLSAQQLEEEEEEF